MLPGIRFLLAAILLSMSILTFGLGAAALLRAAHEEVASVPTRRVMPEPLFAQAPEPTLPTLALLRVEPAISEKAPGPAAEAMPVPKEEMEKSAALKLEDVPSADAPKPDVAAGPGAEAKPDATAGEAAGPAAEQPSLPGTKLAALDAALSSSVETAPVPIEPIALPAITDDADSRATTIAAFGSPALAIEKPAEAGKASEKPDDAETKKRKRAERARERRRLAARRARLAAQQAAAQQAFDPFSQFTQITQPATTATTRRR